MSCTNLISVIIPDNIEFKYHDHKLLFQSDKGEKQFTLSNSILYDKKNNELLLSIDKNNSNKKVKALLGAFVSGINNFIYGVTKGYSLCLEVNGIGYKVGCNDKYLTLSLGFSHDVIYKIPEGIKCECIKQSQIIITGIDKQKVHMIASDLCKIRKYDPYKGKGIVLRGKVMLRKETSKKK